MVFLIHTEVYRKLTAERVSILQENNEFPHARNTKSESKVSRSIKTKLKDSRAMITRADEGNSLVILPIMHYENKIEQFIQSNNFLTFSKPSQKSYKQQQSIYPFRRKMETHKSKPIRTVHQRINQIAQTRTSDSPSSQMERSPRLQTCLAIHTEDQDNSPTTQHIHHR